MAKKKKTKTVNEHVEEAFEEYVHPDTALLNVLQSLLDKQRYTGKIQVRLSKKNKGLEIVEVKHEFPQFSDVREAIKDFGETHGMMGA